MSQQSAIISGKDYHKYPFDRRLLEELHISPVFHIRRMETDGGVKFEVTRNAVVCPACYSITFLRQPYIVMRPVACLNCPAEFLFISALDYTTFRRLDKLRKPCIVDALRLVDDLIEDAWRQPKAETMPATGLLLVCEEIGDTSGTLYFFCEKEGCYGKLRLVRENSNGYFIALSVSRSWFFCMLEKKTKDRKPTRGCCRCGLPNEVWS